MKYCLYCNEILTGRAKKYCNTQCQQNHYWEIRKIVAENDDIGSLETYYEKKNLAKKFLVEKYNNKCVKCGWGEVNEYTNKVPVEMEHKDGNSDNWKLDNLELLCPNCHALTKTYKGANRGQGRHYRRERYKQGKSF